MPLKLKRWPQKSPYWYIRGTVQGQKTCESAGTRDRGEAEAYLIKREREIFERRVFGVERTAIFADAAYNYMERTGVTRFMTPIIEELGMTPLHEIDQTTAHETARKLYPDRKPATLVRNFYTPLLAVLNDAARSGLCARPVIQKPSVPKVITEPSTQGDIDKLIPHCSKHLGAAILFMSYTSARISEATRLDWSHVDLEKAEAYLEQTKPGGPAVVALHPRLVAALANLDHRSGKVFKYAARNSVYKALKSACKRAGVDYDRVKPHKSGRHRFAARLLEEGHSLMAVKEAGHWKTIKTVADNYGHLEQSQVHDIVRGVGKKCSESVESIQDKAAND